jgi:beta-lactamase regulating signal transducer with metallopeptidase domain
MRKKNDFLIHFTLIPLSLIVIAGIFRLICSVEFPNSIVIGSYYIFPAVINFLNTRLFIIHNGDIEIHIYNILLVVWIAGILYYIIKYAHQSITLHKYVHSLPITHDERALSCMDEILVKSHKKTKVKIVQADEIKIPMIIGYFNPVICLPVLQFSNDELENIIMHEWTHFLYKNAWIKMFMYLISSIFWWNPFVHLLRRELDIILEIQCDLVIISKMNEELRINYLNCILKVIRSLKKDNMSYKIPMSCSTMVSTNKVKKIEQRFNLILDYKSKSKNRMLPVVLLCTIIALSFLTSYRIIIQPRYNYVIEANYKESFYINPQNSYLTINEDGTYSLYSDGKYRCNIIEINKEPFSTLQIRK